MGEVIAWVFHSPRRLLVVVVTVIVLLLAGVAVVQAVRGGGSAEPSASASAVPTDAGPAVSAAVDFTRRWASVPTGLGIDQWRAGLAGHVTPDLAQGLADTDPASLPGGTPTGEPVIRFVSVSSALIEVRLSSGPHILVTVVKSGDRWLASDVRPAEGNDGDVPAASVPAASVPAASAPVSGPSGG